MLIGLKISLPIAIKWKWTSNLQSIYHAFQVGCPVPEHLKLGLTNERKVNSHDSRTTHDLPFAHWSVPTSNVQEVDNQLEKHGTITHKNP